MVEITSLIVALGGIALAALGLILTHRERAKFYGDFLYQQQLASARAVAEAAARLHYAIEDEYHLERTHESRVAISTVQRFYRLVKAEAAASAVLLESTLDALETYMNRSAAMVGSLDTAAGIAPDLTEGAHQHEEAAYIELIAALRAQVGTDRLTAETLKRIGEPARRPPTSGAVVAMVPGDGSP